MLLAVRTEKGRLDNKAVKKYLDTLFTAFIDL